MLDTAIASGREGQVGSKTKLPSSLASSFSTTFPRGLEGQEEADRGPQAEHLLSINSLEQLSCPCLDPGISQLDGADGVWRLLHLALAASRPLLQLPLTSMPSAPRPSP